MKNYLRFKIYAKALMKAFWIFSFGILTEQGRSAVQQVAQFSLRGLHTISPKFKPVEISDVCGELDIRIVRTRRQTGEVVGRDVMAICSLVRRFSPKRLFEIGTFRGKTTLHLALNSPPDAEVFTLDLPVEKADQTKFELDPTAHRYIDKVRSGEWFVDSPLPERSKITQLWGDSASFDYGPYEGNIDFVFVDGAHSYDYVMNDTKAALSCARARELLFGMTTPERSNQQSPEPLRSLPKTQTTR